MLHEKLEDFFVGIGHPVKIENTCKHFYFSQLLKV